MSKFIFSNESRNAAIIVHFNEKVFNRFILDTGASVSIIYYSHLLRLFGEESAMRIESAIRPLSK